MLSAHVSQFPVQNALGFVNFQPPFRQAGLSLPLDRVLAPRETCRCVLHTCLWQPGRSQENWVESAWLSRFLFSVGAWLLGKVRDALDGGARWTGQAGGWLAEAGNGPASAECVFRLFTAFP